MVEIGSTLDNRKNMSVKENKINTIILTPFFKNRDDIAFIGANCLPDASRHSDKIIKEQIINPYKNNADIVKATEFCWTTSLDCCDKLGDVLNRLHGLSRGQLYWRTVLLPWMIAFVENLYDRYLRLCIVRDYYQNAAIEIPEIEDTNVLFGSSYDVWRTIYLHKPNVRIYSFLINCMGLNARIKYIKGLFGQYACNQTSETLLQAAKRLYRTVNFHSGNAVFLCHSEKPENIFKVAKKLGWIQWGTPLLKNNGFSKKELDRSKLLFKPTGEEFVDILRQMIRIALPLSLFEEFNERRQIARSFIRKKSLIKVFISGNIWFRDTDRLLAAEVKYSGGMIVGMQHGGGYGHHSISIVERVERSICDYFITWGWKDEGQCPTVALPSPYLSSLSNRHVKKNDDIIFIGTHGPKYMFRYQGYWMPEYVLSNYYNLKRSFFNTLEESVKKQILYKPYPYEYGWNETDRLREILPGIRFFGSGSAVSGMKTCSLVVIDHPATSFIEALQINVPTILYWDDERCPMRPTALRHFQLLKEAGILYYDPVEAAQKVNSIAPNPDMWWAEEKVQKAKEAFCNSSGWANSGWADIWANKLK